MMVLCEFQGVVVLFYDDFIVTGCDGFILWWFCYCSGV